MNLLEKIDFLVKENSLNKRKLSINADIPYSTIDGLYKVGYENMRLPTFRKLCDYFNVTMDSMAYDDREIEYKSDISPAALSREEQELIRTYSRLDDRGKNSVLDTIQREASYSRESLKESSVS